MPIFFLLLIIPPVLFVGGAYLLDYPLSLAALYGINVALMYVVLWAGGNQIIKLQSQQMIIAGQYLKLFRKQLSMIWPLIRQSELEITLNDLRGISLQQTRIGYLLTLRFQQDDKVMGTDLDLNPLRPENRDVLQRVLQMYPGVTTDETTAKIFAEFEKRMASWKAHFGFSLLLVGIAIAVFFAVSVFLGIKGG